MPVPAQHTQFPIYILFLLTGILFYLIKNYTKFNDFADKNGIIAVYPEYTGNWDWDLKSAEKSKDVKFTSEIIDYIIRKFLP